MGALEYTDLIPDWYPGLCWTLRLFWAAASIFLLLVEITLHYRLVNVDALKDVAAWGKTKHWHPSDQHVPWHVRMTNLPKRWFLHFYVIGATFNIVLLLEIILQSQGVNFSLGPIAVFSLLCPRNSCGTPSVGLTETVVGLGLMLVQTGRRTYECLYVSVFSNAQMHVAHYIVGIGFYLLASASIVAESPLAHPSPSQVWHTPTHPAITLLGLLLFVWATHHQYRCHCILAALRPPGKKPGYQIPRGDWFEYVSSPHYLAEVIIYTAIGLAMGGVNWTWWGVVAFTIANLSWGALQTHQWYLSKFDYYPRDRRAIFPWIF